MTMTEITFLYKCQSLALGGISIAALYPSSRARPKILDGDATKNECRNDPFIVRHLETRLLDIKSCVSVNDEDDGIEDEDGDEVDDPESD